MKKDSQVFLRYFGIKHLSDLIGRKFLINLKHKWHDGEEGEIEICFQIQQYSFSVQNLEFIVPTVGIEGNSDIKDVLLSFFPSNNGNQVEYGLSFKSDYLVENGREDKKHISYEGKNGSKSFQVKLL